MYYRLLLLLVLFFETALAQDQQQIQLQINDNSSAPLIKTIISIDQKAYTTDANGRIYLNLLAAKTISMQSVGYEPLQIWIAPGNSYVLELVPLNITLNEVVVRAFENTKSIKQQAASVEVVSKAEIARQNPNALHYAFNLKPGIQIEQRSPSSYRVSIRGSSIRSPFGVRNVKIYWNDIPFTAADGTTALNLLDASVIDKAEIIKGPSGSVYGASNGGVIQLFTDFQSHNTARIKSYYGSYNTKGLRVQLDRVLSSQHQLQAGVSLQESDGFRDHSASSQKYSGFPASIILRIPKIAFGFMLYFLT
ncbi:MAG: TonB-dependent receptor plug domain-containing protein [Flavobacteriaceae bacterium]|nr:TonB-dependent receptor plug domain-containing protein [Flavobacteriaceae bacterium]